MPYRSCFYDLPDLFSSWWFIETAIDLLFTIDFFINCFLGFYNKKNELVMKWNLIFFNYFKTWMLLDLISIFPFVYVISGGDYSSLTNSSSSHIFGLKLSYLTRLPRLYRLIKLFRVLRLFRLLNQNKYIKKYIKMIKINAGVKRIIIVTVSFLLFSHIFACLWYFFAKLQDFDPTTWVFRDGLIDSDANFLYITSLYFALSTLACIGYGDINAWTNTEKALVIIWMMFGTIFSSFLISNIVTVIAHFDTRNIILQEKVNTLNKFANRVKLKNETYLRIKKSFEDNSLNDLMLDQDYILQELPYYLKVEIILHIHQKNIKNIFYFQDRNPNFVMEIIQNWRNVYFQKEEFLYLTDDKPEEVYFINKGECVYTDNEGYIITKFPKGAILGEIEVVLGMPRRFLNLQTVEGCEINVIHVEVLKDIFLRYNDEFISTVKIVKSKYNKYLELINISKEKGFTNEK